MAIAQVGMMGGGGETGHDTIVFAIAVTIVSRGQVGKGGYNLGETRVVKQPPAFHAQLESEVVGGQITHTSDSCFIECFAGAGIATMRLTDGTVLTFTGVDTGPCQHIEIVKTAADKEVTAQLSVIADTGFDLYTIDVGTLLGDDVHHACQGYAAVERRGWASQHLDLFHFLKRDAEIGGGRIGQIAVQPVAVEHDKHFLLRTAVDTAHGDVEIVAAIDKTDARHVGSQDLLQVAPAAGGNHLFGDEGCGYGHFIQTLRHIRGCRNGGCHTGLDPVHDIRKLGRVLC